MKEPEGFFNYIRFEKRFSPHTLTAYTADLEQFRDYLKKNYELDSISEANAPIIRSWVVSLMENKLSPRSVNRKISSLKIFFKYLVKNGKLKVNPMHKIQSPKTSSRLPVFVESGGMDLLLGEVDFGKGYEGLLDRTVIEILYGTGIRLAELIDLRTANVNLKASTIKVLGKRGKERIIPVHASLKDMLWNFTEEKKKLGLDNDLFLTDIMGRPLKRDYVYRTVKKYLSQVTTIDKKSPHVLRHTFATHLLNNGADLNAIKELLGHASLSATQVYTHNTIDKLKNIYKKAHPKA